MALNGNDDVKVGFGASTEGLSKGILDAVRVMQGGTMQMKAALEAVSGAAGTLTKALGAVAAVVAGGKIFAAALSETQKFAGEVGGLARRMDMTAKEASYLAIAIDDVYMSVDDFNGVATHLNRQLRSNEDALKAMGVQTRDSSGHMISQKDAVFKTLDSLKQYKSGTDQLLAAQVAFGRGMDEATLNKLFNLQDALKEVTENGDEFGRVMGVENVKAAREFKRANKDVGDALQGVQIAIGNALMPVFSQLLSMFAKAAASFIPIVAGAFKVLGVILLGITEICYGLFSVFKALVETIVIGATGIVDALHTLFTQGPDAAKEKMRLTGSMIAEAWEAAGKRIEEQSKKSRASMATVWSGGEGSQDDKFKTKGGRSGDKAFTAFDKNAAKDQLEAMKKELALMKQSQGDYQELSKQSEVDFWASKRDIFKRGTKEWMEVQTMYLAARRAAAAESVEIQQFELSEQVSASRNDAEKKVRLAESWLARMTILYGTDSRQYRQALKEKNDADRAYVDQQRQFDDMRAQARVQESQAVLEIAREQTAMLVEMGAMSKEEQVALERQFLQQQYDLNVQEVERKRALYADDVVQQQQLNAEKRRLDIELNRDLAKNSMTMTKTIYSTWTDMLDGLFSTLKSVTQGLLQRTMTWRQATQQVASSLLGSFIELGVKRLRDWVITEVLMTKATSAGTVARAAAQMSGSGAVVAAKTGEAVAVVGANATEAATGAAASQAAIPVVGPALAMAAAAAMLAFVLGMGGQGGSNGTTTPAMPSAAGGWWDIPRDTLAMVHAKEMVMPAHLAEGVRNVVENGGGFGGGFAPSLRIDAVDAQSVERLFMRHSDRLMGALHEAWKNNPRTRK